MFRIGRGSATTTPLPCRVLVSHIVVDVATDRIGGITVKH